MSRRGSRTNGGGTATAPALKWIFDPAPPSGAMSGGLASAHVIEAEIDWFVREVLQNSRDQRIGDEVVQVAFVFYKLSHQKKEQFLTGMGWDQLQAHVASAADQGGVTIGPQLRRALEIIEGDEPLILLRIDDSGTRGLVGGEDDHQANFNLLCRDQLVTPEGTNNRGGSFGLGKSVLWRFSQLSTVLFSSRIGQGAQARFRLFGRAELPFNVAGGRRWQGQGWYGEERALPEHQRRAESVWDTPAEAAARQLYLSRSPELGAGTSILLVGFYEPRSEEARELEELVDAVLGSATRWFWPNLFGERPTMKVTARALDNDTELYRQEAVITPEVEPFTRTMWAPQTVARVSEPGQVAERELALTVPARRDRATGRPGQPVEARLRLRVRLAHEPEVSGLTGATAGPNKLAVMRGFGMVVKYHSPTRTPLTANPYHGVLCAGLARGTSPADQALEQFLRAAEPPAHHDWSPTGTDRLRVEYQRGSQLALRRLWQDVEQAVIDLCQERAPETTEGPRMLATYFPLFDPTTDPGSSPGGNSGRRGGRGPGGGGGGGGAAHFRVESSAFFDGTVWQLSGRVRRTADEGRPWAFSVAAWLDAETGMGSPIQIADLKANHGRVQRSDGTWQCRVPASISEVHFAGQTDSSVEGLGSRDLRRTRLRLQVGGQLRND